MQKSIFSNKSASPVRPNKTVLPNQPPLSCQICRLTPSKRTLYKKSPCAGAVSPAFLRSFAARIFCIESVGADFLSNPIKVPVIVLTIFHKNAFASISKTISGFEAG